MRTSHGLSNWLYYDVLALTQCDSKLRVHNRLAEEDEGVLAATRHGSIILYLK